MPEFICNTSPFQYLHQLGRLEPLPALTKGVIVPNAVVADLGKGESAVLALALESTSPLVILDDALGRRAAELLGNPPSRNAAISRRKYPALRFMIGSSCA